MGIPRDRIEDMTQDLLDRQAYVDWLRRDTALEDDDERRQRIYGMLHAAIRLELTEKQRAYLLAYYMEGLSMPDIAKRYGVGTATVSATIAAARKNLAQALKYTDMVFLRLFEKGDLKMKRENNKSGAKKS